MEVWGPGQVGQSSFDTGSNTENVYNSTVDAAGSNVEVNVTNKSEKGVSEKEIKKAVDKLNNFLEEDNIEVKYEIHPKFKDIMVKIIEKDTGEVITEIPPKKILDMVAKMCEMVGVLFDDKA